jgi:hypothetical protein
MFSLAKWIVDRIMIISHHLGHGLSGALAFGFVAYLLDIGGFRTTALIKGGLDGTALTAILAVAAIFVGFDVVMKRLMGKHGVF